MKDAGGHGSEGRGGRNANIVGATFGKGHGDLPAHQSRIFDLVKSFAKDESGSGIDNPEKIIDHLRDKTPDDIVGYVDSAASALLNHNLDLSTLVNFVHFLTSVAMFMVADLIVLGLQHVVG